jgi:hypothetical protein
MFLLMTIFTMAWIVWTRFMIAVIGLSKLSERGEKYDQYTNSIMHCITGKDVCRKGRA